MGQITVFSGPERRRRWTEELRLQILTEAFAPGASPTAVARRHEISTGQLYTWRNKLAVGAATPPTEDGRPADFAEALVIEDRERAAPVPDAAIIVDLPRDQRMTIFPSASPALVTAVLKALR
ncbi:IS66-like element accessory protein TnpA [Novosphingobium sp.]|uniref:IS66-like element accessory protein TnpA n=1 Tax=Novosphingobium sp. TaxID=1874826 RepID=UPI0038B81FFA